MLNFHVFAGTMNVIDACVACKVKRLIYTSSPSVVFDGVHGIFDGMESIPYPKKVLIFLWYIRASINNVLITFRFVSDFLFTSFYLQFNDSYSETKAEGEKLVLKANGKNGLLTCCIRPSSIFGPGDKLLVPSLASAAKAGKSKVMHVSVQY